jgi:purine nucleoside permease
VHDRLQLAAALSGFLPSALGVSKALTEAVGRSTRLKCEIFAKEPGPSRNGGQSRPASAVPSAHGRAAGIGGVLRPPAVLALILAVFGLSRRAEAQGQPIPVKVVVVAMFELGADAGDRPGEFHHWVEGKQLDRVLPFPQGYRDLRMNDSGVLGVVTGVGTVRAAATIMAPGRTAADQLARAKIGQYAAFLPALDAAYRVGGVVVDRLVTGWATYRDTPPSASPRQ